MEGVSESAAVLRENVGCDLLWHWDSFGSFLFFTFIFSLSVLLSFIVCKIERMEMLLLCSM